MNADFEAELGAGAAYRRIPTVARRNRELAPALLWLAREGDALLVEPEWPDALRAEAARRGVDLTAADLATSQAARRLEPWGWTAGAVEAGARVGAALVHPPLDAVLRVNSKVFSHALERELGVALAGAKLATSLDELDAAAARACPRPGDKWVVKSPYGFAARGRVLGRGPRMDAPSAVWAERRFAEGETLLFEPWLDVTREYGVQMRVGRDGAVDVLGVTRMLTNGAGATTGYVLGERIVEERVDALERIARAVGARLAAEGYFGPANVDALEHAGGLRPLVEINARYTMGFVALAVERALAPPAPRFWSPRDPWTTAHFS